MKKLLIIGWITCCGMALANGVDSTDFGNVTITINDMAPQSYVAKSAKLYRNVALEYQNVLQLQSAAANEQYFYSQLSRGDRYVLHLILEAATSEKPDSLPKSYDLYFDLGDTLSENMQFANRDSAVFVYPRGAFPSSEYFSRSQSGRFSIVDQGESYGVKGNFSTDFEFPDPEKTDGYRRYSMSGELSIPAENYLQGGETGLQSVSKKSSGIIRSLMIAAVLTAIIVAISVSPGD